jgi:Cyclophilin type peptidyl-prolyl cis-trans isomerase/CLD
VVGGALTVLLLVVALLGFVYGTGNLSMQTWDITVGKNPTTTVSATAQATCDLHTHHCTKAPLMTIDVNKPYMATIKTVRGDFVIKFDAKHAPNAVNNFVFLAQTHWYDGDYFWRVEQPGKPSPLDNQPSDLSLVQGRLNN